MSVNLTELVKRPGAGSVGKPVRVRAKFFEVTNFTNGNIHHYDVTLDPPSTPPAVQRKVWKTFEDTDGQGILQGITTVYDGCKNVLSFKPLPLGEDNAMQFEVELQENSGPMDSEAQLSSYAVVKPDLQKVMYFM